MSVVALLILAAVPRLPVTDETVDCLERNYCHGCQGEPRFLQWIGWDELAGWKMDVRDWRIIPAGRHYVFLPGERPVLLFHDGDRLRVLRGRRGRTTWTQHDPEMDERERLPQEGRRLFAR